PLRWILSLFSFLLIVVLFHLQYKFLLVSIHYNKLEHFFHIQFHTTIHPMAILYLLSHLQLTPIQLERFLSLSHLDLLYKYSRLSILAELFLYFEKFLLLHSHPLPDSNSAPSSHLSLHMLQIITSL